VDRKFLVCGTGCYRLTLSGSFADLSSYLYAFDNSIDGNVGFYCIQSADELDDDIEEKRVA